jgi:cell division protein FtsL
LAHQLAQAHKERTLAAQRDHYEIQEKIQDLLEAFTQYISNQSTLPRGATFQMVARDIERVRLPTSDWIDALTTFE